METAIARSAVPIAQRGLSRHAIALGKWLCKIIDTSRGLIDKSFKHFDEALISMSY